MRQAMMDRCNICRMSFGTSDGCLDILANSDSLFFKKHSSSSWVCVVHSLTLKIFCFECHRLRSVMSGTPMISDVPMSPETDDLCYLSTTPCQFGNCSACLWAPISWSPYMKDKVLPSTRKLVLKKGKAFAFQACARTTRLRDIEKDSLLQALGPWQSSST